MWNDLDDWEPLQKYVLLRLRFVIVPKIFKRGRTDASHLQPALLQRRRQHRHLQREENKDVRHKTLACHNRILLFNFWSRFPLTPNRMKYDPRVTPDRNTLTRVSRLKFRFCSSFLVHSWFSLKGTSHSWILLLALYTVWITECVFLCMSWNLP